MKSKYLFQYADDTGSECLLTLSSLYTAVSLFVCDFSRRQKSSQKNNSVLDILFKHFLLINSGIGIGCGETKAQKGKAREK